MGFFSKTLAKLGVGRDTATAAPTLTAAPMAPGAAPTAPPPPKPVALVDRLAPLEQLAAANPQKPNWRTSTVDLLRVLDIDSRFPASKDLATVAMCPGSCSTEPTAPFNLTSTGP